MAATQFSLVTPENACKMSSLRPSAESYSFERCDAVFHFAASAGQIVRGHTLVWHNQNPQWLQDSRLDNATELARELRKHVSDVLARYPHAYSMPGMVVNEPTTSEV